MQKLIVILSAVFTILISSICYSQTAILRCVDSKGKTEFATFCPMGSKATNTNIYSNNTGSKTTEVKPNPPIHPSTDNNIKGGIDNKNITINSVDQEKLAKEKAQNCASAQSNLKIIQSGIRLVRRDPQTGERIYYSDQDRDDALSKAEEAIKTICN